MKAMAFHKTVTCNTNANFGTYATSTNLFKVKNENPG